jgi:hypothetical protein
MPFDLTQLGILALSGTGIWLVGRPEPRRRVGYILGLAAQPFWFYMSITDRKWGVAILTLFCTYGWVQGVWFHWFKPERVLPETPTRTSKTDTQPPTGIIAGTDRISANTGEMARSAVV